MFKIFAIIMLTVTTIFAVEEVGQLEQQREQLHEKTSAAGKFAQLAKYVVDNESQALESNNSLKQQFKEMQEKQGESSLIALRSVATKEDAVAARSYYLGVRGNLFAAEIVTALEIIALQASAIDQSERDKMNLHFSKTFDFVKKTLTDSNLGIPDIEKKDVSTAENAIAARTYYKGVKEDLLGRTEAMAEGKSFG